MATIMEALDKKLGNEKKSMTIMDALGSSVGTSIDKAVAKSDKLGTSESAKNDPEE